MPRRFNRVKKRRPHRRFRPRQRRRRMARNTTLQKQGLIVSDRQFVKLSYIDVTTPVLSGTVSHDNNLYYVNGLYDVNSAVASTSVPGYAEWISMYANYRVHGVKLIYECVNYTGVASGLITGEFPIYMFSYISPQIAPASTWTTFMELQGNRYFKSKVLSIPGGGHDRGVIKQYVSLPALIGDKRQYLSDDIYTGANGTNPTATIPCFCGILSMDGTSSNLLTAYVKVRFVFYCEFFNRKTLFA